MGYIMPRSHRPRASLCSRSASSSSMSRRSWRPHRRSPPSSFGYLASSTAPSVTVSPRMPSSASSRPGLQAPGRARAVARLPVLRCAERPCGFLRRLQPGHSDVGSPQLPGHGARLCCSGVKLRLSFPSSGWRWCPSVARSSRTAVCLCRHPLRQRPAAPLGPSTVLSELAICAPGHDRLRRLLLPRRPPRFRLSGFGSL